MCAAAWRVEDIRGWPTTAIWDDVPVRPITYVGTLEPATITPNDVEIQVNNPIDTPAALQLANTPAEAAENKIHELALKKKLGNSIWNLIHQQPKFEGLRTFILNKTNKWVPEDIEESAAIVDWLRTALWTPPPPPPPPAPPKPKRQIYSTLMESEIREYGTAAFERKTVRSGEIAISREILIQLRNESVNSRDFQNKLDKYLQNQAKEQGMANIPLYNIYPGVVTGNEKVETTDIIYCNVPYCTRLINEFLYETPYNFETKTEIETEIPLIEDTEENENDINEDDEEERNDEDENEEPEPEEEPDRW